MGLCRKAGWEADSLPSRLDWIEWRLFAAGSGCAEVGFVLRMNSGHPGIGAILGDAQGILVAKEFAVLEYERISLKMGL